MARRKREVTTTVVSGSAVTDFDACARTQSGQLRWINVSILTYPAPDNATPLIVHLFRDATKKKQNEQFTHQVLSAIENLQESAAPGAAFSASAGPLTKDLTDREREVLALLTQGLGTEEIAQSLSISPSTVRNHVQSILHKLDVHSRLEAVAYTFEHGLVTRK
jgi:DNA-binding CsgD family transcriptional regulator